VFSLMTGYSHDCRSCFVVLHQSNRGRSPLALPLMLFYKGIVVGKLTSATIRHDDRRRDASAANTRATA